MHSDVSYFNCSATWVRVHREDQVECIYSTVYFTYMSNSAEPHSVKVRMKQSLKNVSFVEWVGGTENKKSYYYEQFINLEEQSILKN